MTTVIRVKSENLEMRTLKRTHINYRNEGL